jgi:hypothetical protein
MPFSKAWPPAISLTAGRAIALEVADPCSGPPEGGRHAESRAAGPVPRSAAGLRCPEMACGVTLQLWNELEPISSDDTRMLLLDRIDQIA